MLRVVQKVWVAKFYEQNAALLLLVFFIMFGLVQANHLWQYHLGLVYGTLGSYGLMAIVATVWMLYALRSIYFITLAMRQPQHALLFELNKLATPSRLMVIFYAHACTQLPVYLYALFMAAVAIYEASWVGLLFVVGTNLILLIGACIWINRLFTHTHASVWRIPITLPQWNKPVPYAWFYLGWIKHQHTVAWLLTKLFSGLAIVLFLQIETEGYDPRPAALGLLLALTGHVVLIAELHKLEDRYLHFIRALPLSKLYRYAQLLLVYALLLAPELLILAFNHLFWWDVCLLALLGTVVLMFWHTQLYAPTWTMDKHTRKVIITYLILFMTVLSGGYWFAALVLLFTSLILYWQGQDAYEASAVS